MSVRKNMVRKRLAEYRAVLEAISELLDDIGFICPYASHPHELGEIADMLEYDEKGNGKLPDFCTMSGSKDYFGEYDEDCTGAKDGRSCWLHYYGLSRELLANSGGSPEGTSVCALQNLN